MRFKWTTNENGLNYWLWKDSVKNNYGLIKEIETNYYYVECKLEQKGVALKLRNNNINKIKKFVKALIQNNLDIDRIKKR